MAVSYYRGMAELTGVLETALTVDDVARSIRFYHGLFGFEPMDADDQFGSLNILGRQVLLLFRKGTSAEPKRRPGGVIPGHDASGTTHLAFAIPAAAFNAWQARLAAQGVPVESVFQWERGGRSLYFRDPDGHLLELVTPGCWSIY
jgi:catechol 2,3-dioxygenase-like lactoylglutathione lyase family enzyme